MAVAPGARGHEHALDLAGRGVEPAQAGAGDRLAAVVHHEPRAVRERLGGGEDGLR